MTLTSKIGWSHLHEDVTYGEPRRVVVASFEKLAVSCHHWGLNVRRKKMVR
jgi:hypothetical protein